MATYQQGVFRPKNPTKYRGDSSNIIYRSGWELQLMFRLDRHPDVLQWASEELVIPYRSPIDGKVHRYFPDFWVKKRTKDGQIVIDVIEIKPAKETQPPTKRKRITPRYLYEVKTWGTNNAKWEAAYKYCKERGWNFHIMTEKELGIK